MRTGPPTGALPKPNFACVHQPSAIPSGVFFFGGWLCFLGGDVLWCDVVWCHVLGCQTGWSNVVGCQVTWGESMWLVARCHVMWCHWMWCDVMWYDVWCVMHVIWCDVMRSDVVVMQWDGMLHDVTVCGCDATWLVVRTCDVMRCGCVMGDDVLWTGMQNAIRLLRAHVTVLRPGTTKY